MSIAQDKLVVDLGHSMRMEAEGQIGKKSASQTRCNTRHVGRYTECAECSGEGSAEVAKTFGNGNRPKVILASSA